MDINPYVRSGQPVVARQYHTNASVRGRAFAMHCFVDAPGSSPNPDLSSAFTGPLLRDPRQIDLGRHPGSILRVTKSLAM